MNENLVILLTSVAVGGSTFVGSLCAFLVKKISHRANDMFMSFAAGIMLGATVFSLIIPALDGAGNNFILPCLGIISGALLVNLLDFAVPHLHNVVKADIENRQQLNKVLLFLCAIAIHNFPEGMAVGVSFGGGDFSNAYGIAIGISLQNILEGMITILPLIAAGVKKKTAIIVAVATGLSEVIGVVLGYGAANIASAALPFVLALAGGTMLYVISHDMIPETHSHGFEKWSTYSLIAGFIAMIIIDNLL